MRYLVICLFTLAQLNTQSQILDSSFNQIGVNNLLARKLANKVIAGPSDENKAQAYRYRGMASRSLGDQDDALESFQNALDAGKKLSDTLEIIKTLSVLGEMQVALNAPEDAISNIDQALELAEKIGNEHLSIMALNSKGTILAMLGSSRLASELIEEAVQRAEIEGKSEELLKVALLNLTALKEQNEDYIGARRVYRKTIRQLENSNEPGLLLAAYNNLGGNYMDQSMLDSAAFWFEKAYSKAIEAGMISSLEKVLKNRMQLAELAGAPSEALLYSKEIILLKDTMQDVETMSRIGRLQEDYKRKVEDEEAAALALLEKSKREREDLLQYSGILVFLLFLFIFVFYSGRLSFPSYITAGIIFLAFVLLFEFALVLLDPKIEELTGGQPILKLIANAGIALLIIPLHGFFERKLRARTKNRKSKLN